MTDEQILELAVDAFCIDYDRLDGRFTKFARAILAAGASEGQAWHPIATAPRDGSNILIRFGRDGVSQAKYVAGTPHPWKFIDTNDGITWLINHAVDTEYGPTHWMPLPPPDTSVEVAALRKERDHWKANHDAQVSRARLLIERTDLPLERVRAYEELAALRERIAGMEKDAERYRWLRQQRFEFNHSRITPVRPDKLDTMIDVAIAKEKQG